MLGATLVSRYKIVEELSRGGFGQTFVAEDMHLPGHPKCVIKQLKPLDTRPLVLEAARKLFDREAQALYRLGKHDRIPSLLAHFEEGSEFYLAQEFIEGRVLSDEILPGQRLSESYVVKLLQDLLHILDFVHQQNAIHRDIKPSNLIRRASDNEIVLIDFGAVKETSLQTLGASQGHTSSTIAVGTYGYMPDEQANGRPKFASDIYAAGMLCIQALTGALPTQLPENTSTGEVVWRNLVPSIHPELAELLEKMVRSHFTQRYQSASEALEALQKLSIPVTSVPVVATNVLPAPAATTNVLSAPVATTSVLPAQPPAPNVLPSTEIQPSPTPPGFPATQPVVKSTVRLAPDPSQTVLQPDTMPAVAAKPASNQPQFLRPPNPAPAGPAVIPPPVVSKRNKGFVWFGIGTVAAVSAIAGYVYFQNESDRRLVETIERAKSSRTAGNFTECIERAKQVPRDSRYAKDAQTLLSECQAAQTNAAAKVQLAQAQKLAKENKLEEAIAAASKIDSSSSSYAEAQKLIAQWSESLLQVAAKQYQELGKLKEAIALTKVIPSNTPNGKKAQELSAKWQTQWNADEAAAKAAEKALKEKRWNDAIAESKKVTTPYWKKQTEPIIQKANVALTPVSAPASQPTYTEPAAAPVYRAPEPTYQAPAPVYRAPEPAYVPPAPRNDPPSVDNLPAPSKGN